MKVKILKLSLNWPDSQWSARELPDSQRADPANVMCLQTVRAAIATLYLVIEIDHVMIIVQHVRCEVSGSNTLCVIADAPGREITFFASSDKKSCN